MENIFKNKGRDSNKSAISSRINKESRQASIHSSRELKRFGPYRIKNICGIEGIGLEPEKLEHEKGLWFIGEINSGNGSKTFWVRVDNDVLTSDRMDSVGILEENYIGRLFYIKAFSQNTSDLARGKAYLLDDIGVPGMPGYPDAKIANKLESTFPVSIASLCGPFTFKMPNLGQIMSKINGGK
jgi:hypothetical protein